MQVPRREVHQGPVTQARSLRSSSAPCPTRSGPNPACGAARRAWWDGRPAIEQILCLLERRQRRVALPDACRRWRCRRRQDAPRAGAVRAGPSSSMRRWCRRNATRSSPARRSIRSAPILWARAGLTADDEERVRHDKISGYLEELGRNTPENRSLVASLLGMAAPASSTAAATAATAQARTIRIHRFARRAGGARATGDPLDRRRALAGPVVGRTAAGHCDRRGTIARSGGADDAAVSQGSCPRQKSTRPCAWSISAWRTASKLARSVPGASVLSDEMISKAVAAADGVPFFLEQLVISLIEEQSQGPAPHRRLGGVPLMLAELMSERLDRRPGRAAYRAGGGVHWRLVHAGLSAHPAQGRRRGQVQERLEALVEAEILRAAALRCGGSLRIPARPAAADGARIHASCRATAHARSHRRSAAGSGERRTDRSRKRSPITSPKRARLRRRSARGCGRG